MWREVKWNWSGFDRATTTGTDWTIDCQGSSPCISDQLSNKSNARHTPTDQQRLQLVVGVKKHSVIYTN